MSKRAAIVQNDPPSSASPAIDLDDFEARSPNRSRRPSADDAAKIREVGEQSDFKSREATPRNASPTRRTRVRRTGRNIQLNLRVTQATYDRFYELTDRHGWVLGETLEKALDALVAKIEAESRQ